jgi:MFS family permease
MSTASAVKTSPKKGGLRTFIYSLRALKHRDFRIFWIGALLTNTGKFLTAIAVPIVLYQITGSAVIVGLATTFQYVPGVIMGPIGGALADKINKRKLIIFAQFGMMASTLLMWAAWTLFEVREPSVILCLVGLIALFNGLTIPAWAAFINDLVPRGDLMSGVTLNSLQNNIAKAMGPALAGVLLLAFGVNWAFLISAGSFLFVIAALFALRTVPVNYAQQVRGNFFVQTFDAGRYTWASKGILVAILLSVLIGLAGNPIYGFTVVLGAEVYGVNAGGVGALNLALGLGAIFSAPIVAGLNDTFRMSRVIGGSVVLYGVALLAISLSDSFLVGMIALTILGAAALASLSAINTAIQYIVAGHMRGRVLGLRHVVYTLSFPVGAVALGTVADQWGVQVAIMIGGLAMIAVVLLLSVVPGTVRMGRLDDPHDDQTGSEIPAPTVPSTNEKATDGGTSTVTGQPEPAEATSEKLVPFTR